MNVLIVSEYFEPKMAGGERIFYELGKELVKRGHAVFVVTSRLPKTEERETLDGMEVHRPFPSGGFLQRLRFMARLHSYLPSAIRRWKIDLIHTNTYIPMLPAGAASRKTGVPLLASIHLYVGSAWFRIADPFHALINYVFETWIPRFSKPDAIHVTSKQAVKVFSHVTKAPVRLIYNLIDEEKFGTTYRRADVQKMRMQYRVKGKCFVFVGSFTRYKNILNTIKGARRSPEQFTFLIIGSGPLESQVKRLIRDDARFIFVGQLPHAEALKVVAICDCLVLTSNSEQFPLTILEALALGRQVIATPVGGVPDIKGFKDLHLIGSARELPQAMRRIRKIPKKGLDKKAIKAYSRERIIDQYVSLYEEVLRA